MISDHYLSFNNYQVVKDVSLMKMDSDECLKLSSLDLGEVLCRHVDECVEYIEEDLISGAHDFLVGAGVGKSDLCISGPDKLNTKDPNLNGYIKR